MLVVDGLLSDGSAVSAVLPGLIVIFWPNQETSFAKSTGVFFSGMQTMKSPQKLHLEMRKAKTKSRYVGRAAI